MTLQMGRSWVLAWGLMTLHLLYSSHPVEGLIGYECNGSTLNITTVSLLEVGGCDIPQQEVSETGVHIQLLQINQYASVHVRQCKVEIYRVIRRCGMWSHGMDVPNGEFSYVDSVSRDVCLDLYKYGKMKIGQTEVHDIFTNYTTNRPVSIAGTVTSNSECEGVHYSDPYGNWDKVYVQGTVKITLRDYRADVDVDTNKVHLKSGMRCELDEGRCIDIDGGDTYWDPFPEDSCKSKRYGVLYEGPAMRTTDLETRYKQTMYSLTEGDVIFALAAKDRTMVCGYTLIRTEHPKLLIVEIRKGDPFVKKEALSVSNLDLFAYVNSKFVYVEKYIRTQMKQMYRDVLIQRCNLERQVLENTIGLAKQTPDEFAYNVMKGPGYMAVLAGEVAHIVKCIPLEVKVRATTECYTQLPVRIGNSSHYLSPRTHILKRTGTQVTCNHLVPSMYQIEGEWYALEPRPVHATAPTVLRPLTENTWNYRNPQALAVSGIYTQKDLDDLRDHIMFPAERPAILNSVARGIAGQPTITQGGSISNLLDEQTIDKIIETSWEKSWGYFSTFGTFSAGLIGLFMIVRGIKLVIDTLIHGYALHTIYGWSIFLVGAIWDSVTNLLLHLSRQPPKTERDDDNNDDHNNDNNDDETKKPLRCEKPPSYRLSELREEDSDYLPMQPLHFNFDPRVYDLQRPFSPEAPAPYRYPPAETHTSETPRSHLNSSRKVEPTTLPRNFTWYEGQSTKRTSSIYKVPRRMNLPIFADQGMEPKECIPQEESVLLQTPGPSNTHEMENTDINKQTIYPTLEKVKQATDNLPTSEKKQMFLCLEKRTNN